ncbi:MAG TPA: hypothetical protein VG347_01675 [Verrucomicrobiae bacterium]|nr:hypothetical protein [Verrucomicrobiae bacterium]
MSTFVGQAQFSLMSGAGSIPFAIAACVIGGTTGFWLAVVGFCMLIFFAAKTTWACRNEQVKMEGERAIFKTLQGVETENRTLKSEVSRLNAQIADESPKVLIDAKMGVGYVPPITSVNLKINVVNNGKNPFHIQRVFVYQKELFALAASGIVGNQEPELVFIAEGKNIGEIIKIEAHGGRQFYRKDFMSNHGLMECAGKVKDTIVGKGVVELSTGDKFPFEFETPTKAMLQQAANRPPLTH